MNILKLIINTMFLNCAVNAIERYVPETINLDDVVKETKRYWVDQFKFFEERGGFTKEMMESARAEYFGEDFIVGTYTQTKMALITVID